jgi:tetratricopeptide (TPR) repeat protein
MTEVFVGTGMEDKEKIVKELKFYKILTMFIILFVLFVSITNISTLIFYGYGSLAHYYIEKGNYKKAENTYIKSISFLKKTAKKSSYFPEDAIENLAKLYVIQGKYKKAEEAYLEIINLSKNKSGSVSELVMADLLEKWGYLYEMQGKSDDSKKLYQKVFKIRKKYFLHSVE